VKIEAITIDLWGTLLFDGPASDDRYKKRRMTDFHTLLGAAGLAPSPSALDRAYEQSASHLGRIWATHRDVPAEDHVRAILTAVDPALPRGVPPALMTALLDAYARPILLLPPAVDDGALAALETLKGAGYKLVHRMTECTGGVQQCINLQGRCSSNSHLVLHGYGGAVPEQKAQPPRTRPFVRPR